MLAAVQNIIFINANNPVVIGFDAIDLSQLDRVSAQFGDDLRDSVNNPDSVVVQNPTELRLFFNDTTETKTQYWEIKGYDIENPQGFVLTNRCYNNLPPTGVCQDAII